VFSKDGVTAYFDPNAPDHLSAASHAHDLMNSGTGITDERQLITEKDLDILDKAYDGYTKTSAATTNRRTFYVTHNTAGASGQLYIQGSNNGDIIYVDDQGSQLEIK
jgi:hypothetical protein